MRGRRGSTILEGALVFTTFVLVLVGVIDFGRLGFAYNSITFAARQAARYAAVNGSASVNPANAATIRANVRNNLVGLNTSSKILNVTTTWIPPANNSPGSQVQVVVSYAFQPLLVPISPNALTLKSTAVDYITQ